MDTLRLILLLIGAAVILAIYLWTRYRQHPPRRRPRRRHDFPDSDAEASEDSQIDAELARMEQIVASEAEQVPSPDGERLLVISVVAPEGEVFRGEALAAAFQHNRLKYGEHDIYHRLVVHAGSQLPVFSVANLVKPGTFPAQEMEFFSTRGVTLFLQLPAPVDGLEAFDDFVNTAERLAVELGGNLKDEKHCVVTHQTLMQLREEIAESRLRSRIA